MGQGAKPNEKGWMEGGSEVTIITTLEGFLFVVTSLAISGCFYYLGWVSGRAKRRI